MHLIQENLNTFLRKIDKIRGINEIHFLLCPDSDVHMMIFSLVSCYVKIKRRISRRD